VLQKLIIGYSAGNQLTLVCAPAGYGKTTAVLEFLHAAGADSAWISLDEGDNDAQRFLAYLVAALRKAQVPIGNDIDSLLTDIGMKTTETVLTMLVNDIAICSGKKVIVLDDYHVIHSSKVNDMLKFLLGHQPPNLHLIIISREDPQLPLSRLRMKDKLTELRADDLLFSCDEAAELFNKSTEIKLGSEAVQKLTHRTEGWIAGLQLAALLLKSIRQDQIDDYIGKFDGTNSYIIDYMVEEVLEHQPQEISDFLCKTSVLERMNDKLCNELTGRCDSREVLQRIDKANLFLIPLDDKREWSRYHHLFADSLKIRLSEEDEKELYGKAAVWMKSNGFSYEAVRYAFKSKDMILAMKMVEDTTLEAFQNAQLESLVKWLEMLPEDMIKKSEVLSVRKAIACFITGRNDEAIKYMNSLDDNFEQKASPHNKGLLYYLKAVTAGLMGQDSEPFAREALKYLQPWDPIARTSALNNLGRAQYMKGQVSDALVTLKNAYEEGLKLGYQFVTVLALMNYSSCLHATGQSKKALTLCEQYIAQMKSKYDKLPPFVGILYVTMSGFYSSSNDTKRARLLKEEGLELCRSISYDVEGSLKIFNKATGVKEVKEAAGVINFVEKLSERELEVLTLLGKGLSNREIAKTLFITINTTQWHISHIYEKLGTKSRTQAILKAKEFGILK
jgi:LuxR family maltose regulon positive regulatory protein